MSCLRGTEPVSAASRALALGALATVVLGLTSIAIYEATKQPPRERYRHDHALFAGRSRLHGTETVLKHWRKRPPKTRWLGGCRCGLYPVGSPGSSCPMSGPSD